MSKYQKLANNDYSTSTLTDDENFAIFPQGSSDDHQNDDDAYQVEDLIQYNDKNALLEHNTKNINSSPSTPVVAFMNGADPRLRSGNVNGNSSNLLITTHDFDDSTMEIPLLQRGTSSDNNHNGSYNNKDDLEYGWLCQQKGFASNLNCNSAKTAKSKILWAVGMCCIFMIVEFLGGYIAGSLAIMTDAAHLASDCISFVIGLVAICLGSRPPDAKMSFGYKRVEVMGALASILGIWILTATLVLVAIQRMYANDYDLSADTMMVISAIGILINIIMIFILHTSSAELPEGGIGASHGHSHSHNHGHNHSHNQHHGHSHHHSSPQSHSPHFQRRHLRHSLESSHLHLEHSAQSIVTSSTILATSGHDGRCGNTLPVDTSKATSPELSPGPLVENGLIQQRSHSPHFQRNHLRHNSDSNHPHLERSTGSIVTSSITSASGGHTGEGDTSVATALELSPSPLVVGGNGLKHQQDGKHKNLNLRAAMIHVIGDLVQSCGVFIASIFIKIYPRAVILDPLCTLLFSIIVIMTTLNLFKESIHILMDSVPNGISLEELEMELLDIEGVKSVHHLNVWNHTSNHSVLMAHLVIDFLADSNNILMHATQIASSPKYNVKHSTIQIERAAL